MVKHGLLFFTIILASMPSFPQLPALNKLKTISDKVTALDKYIEYCFTNEKFEEAKKTSLFALKLSQQAKIDTLIAKNFYYTGFSYKNLSNFDSAIYYFNQLLKSLLKIQPRLAVKTQLNLASSYENIGLMDSVFSIMKKLETNIYLLTDSLSADNVKYLMFRGVLNEDKGNYEKALEDYMRSLHISQIIKDSATITDNLVNIGAFYFNLEKYQKSLEYYEQAQIYFNQSGKVESLQACTSFRTMGLAYERIGRKELGLMYANNSVRIAKNLKINKLLIFCYSGIASIYLEIKDYQHAEYYYLKALDFLKNTDLKFNKLTIYGQLGLVNYQQKKYSVAKSYFEKAQEIALEVGRKSSISTSYRDLAKTEAAMGNFPNAYKYQTIYTIYKDSINAETSSKNIAEMEAKYQTEKKQQQIALLDAQNKAQTLQLKNQKQVEYSLLAGFSLILIIAGLFWRSYLTKQKVNRELNEKNDEISAANEELTVLNEKLHEANLSKTKLFSIISHDLRSPVVSLFQYLKMQEKNFLQLDELSKQKYNETIIQSAENLAEVMEDLLIWSKSQMEHFELSPETVTIKGILTEIIQMHDISSRQKGILVQMDCPSGLTFITDANFLKIIVRNLVNNAIKFSPERGKVQVSALIDLDGLKLSIKNNGKGITKEQIADLNNWQSIKSSPSGMGLKLTKEFIEKLNGTLEILSESGNGIEFLVNLRQIRNFPYQGMHLNGASRIEV